MTGVGHGPRWNYYACVYGACCRTVRRCYSGHSGGRRGMDAACCGVTWLLAFWRYAYPVHLLLPFHPSPALLHHPVVVMVVPHFALLTTHLNFVSWTGWRHLDGGTGLRGLLPASALYLLTLPSSLSRAFCWWQTYSAAQVYNLDNATPACALPLPVPYCAVWWPAGLAALYSLTPGPSIHTCLHTHCDTTGVYAACGQNRHLLPWLNTSAPAPHHACSASASCLH